MKWGKDHYDYKNLYMGKCNIGRVQRSFASLTAFYAKCFLPDSAESMEIFSTFPEAEKKVEQLVNDWLNKTGLKEKLTNENKNKTV